MDLNIQVLSDVHTERDEYSGNDWKKYVEVCGDIVVLCGDIGSPLLENYWSFLKYVSSRTKLVLLVSGNHEYWNSDTATIDTMIQSRVSLEFENVKYLQRDWIVVGNTVFLGCTLWSYMPNSFRKSLENWCSDFRFIKDCKDATVYNEWHFRDVKWLIDSIQYFRRKKYRVVVVTHFSPIFDLNFNPFHNVSWKLFAYNSDLQSLFKHVSGWIYGHTHFDYDFEHIYRVSGYPTLFLSNQRGNPSKIKPRYDPKFCISIDKFPKIDTIAWEIVVNYDNQYANRVVKKVEMWRAKNRL